MTRPLEEQPAPRRMIGDDVYERIKALLMDRGIAPDARLSIDGLAREFSVSQTPVREALARLESDGLVVKIPLRGYRATSLLTEKQIDDLYQFRLVIEPWSAGHAAKHVDDTARAALMAEFASISPPEDSTYEAYQALAAHEYRIHTLFAKLSGNEQMVTALERTNFHLHIYRLGWDFTFGEPVLHEHRHIADRIMAGDAAGAKTAMIEHLNAGRYERMLSLVKPLPTP